MLHTDGHRLPAAHREAAHRAPLGCSETLINQWEEVCDDIALDGILWRRFALVEDVAMWHHNNHRGDFPLRDEVINHNICPSKPGAPVGVIVS